MNETRPVPRLTLSVRRAQQYPQQQRGQQRNEQRGKDGDGGALPYALRPQTREVADRNRADQYQREAQRRGDDQWSKRFSDDGELAGDDERIPTDERED